MKLWLVAGFLLFVASGANAVDDTRFFKLEQDVRNLERLVQDLSRHIDEMRASGRGDSGRPGVMSSRPGPSTRSSDGAPWLTASNWSQVKAGMSELEVISVLGAPTSMRTEDGARVLLYAMEIGSGGFLSGSVTLTERKVTEVTKPTLR
jgi:hypothetical protein